MNELLLEPFGGMAGDMLLAALLDLEHPRFSLADLTELGQSLVPGEVKLSAKRVWRRSLSGLCLDVTTPESVRSPERHYRDLEVLVRGSSLSAPAQEKALAVLWCIAVAEARVHDTTPEKIHFHEVGAVDTLIDVCGAVLADERLGSPRWSTTPPLVGSGTVRCAHGEMPVPAPAVAEILRGHPHRLGGGCERLTPTGAAILVTMTEGQAVPSDLTVEAVGYGAGHRDPEEGPPNLMRVQWGRDQDGSTSRAWQLDVNLDDMTGQELGHLARELREAGALDVWTTPVGMKKDRPGVVLSLLCRQDQRATLEALVFAGSSTFGVRWHEVQRSEAERAHLEVELDGQVVRVKLRRRPGQTELQDRDLAPEYEDLARLTRASSASLRELEARAVALARVRLDSGESPFDSPGSSA